MIVKTVGSGRRKRLIITVDISRSVGISATGKSIVIATSGGNKEVPGEDNMKYNLNVLIPVSDTV